MLARRQAGFFHRQRQRHEAGHQQDMQTHDAEIQLQQTGVAQYLAEAAAHDARFTVQNVAVGGRHDRKSNHDTGQGQHGNHPK
ncbi:hypothetical protein D3C79_822170 [compost metagenome]